mmetsp:Transcript_10247/g.36096  ORF Transcript_10247/g.36096 Transcript_10247/m.36096 type:complete len:203 (+) Transcript_10247:808-1416(+)
MRSSVASRAGSKAAPRRISSRISAPEARFGARSRASGAMPPKPRDVSRTSAGLRSRASMDRATMPVDRRATATPSAAAVTTAANETMRFSSPRSAEKAAPADRSTAPVASTAASRAIFPCSRSMASFKSCVSRSTAASADARAATYLASPSRRRLASKAAVSRRIVSMRSSCATRDDSSPSLSVSSSFIAAWPRSWARFDRK